jgi:hypothetical protein
VWGRVSDRYLLKNFSLTPIVAKFNLKRVLIEKYIRKLYVAMVQVTMVQILKTIEYFADDILDQSLVKLLLFNLVLKQGTQRFKRLVEVLVAHYN